MKSLHIAAKPTDQVLDATPKLQHFFVFYTFCIDVQVNEHFWNNKDTLITIQRLAKTHQERDTMGLNCRLMCLRIKNEITQRTCSNLNHVFDTIRL